MCMCVYVYVNILDISVCTCVYVYVYVCVCGSTFTLQSKVNEWAVLRSQYCSCMEASSTPLNLPKYIMVYHLSANGIGVTAQMEIKHYQ